MGKRDRQQSVIEQAIAPAIVIVQELPPADHNQIVFLAPSTGDDAADAERRGLWLCVALGADFVWQRLNVESCPTCGRPL